MRALLTPAALPLLVVPRAVVASSVHHPRDVNALPDGPPGAGTLSIHPRFRSHLKCPYADRWLAKGPERAAFELGLDERGRTRRGRRGLEEMPPSEEVRGSCTYANAFSGLNACLQFVGPWTDEDMSARCDEESGSAFSAEGCAGEVGGWCVKAVADDRTESTAMVLSAMADCGASKMACEAFISGTFVEDGECASGAAAGNMFEETGEPAVAGGPPPGVAMGGGGGPPPGAAAGGGSYPGAAAAAPGGGDSMKCLIAPGAIGAAHQAGFSKGYSASCPGTPAQESPYMWPLAWSADTEMQHMAYGSDDVVFKSRGRTFYMLDKNWKRSDTTFQEGFFKALFTGPCDDVDEDSAEQGLQGCGKNQTDGTMSTMIHRESLMYFISWKDDAEVEVGEKDASKIEECTMINLAVVGNIRPDWFLDKRGDDTDVQYLGDQHVYYADGALPKLVKQWRKKDFASQYFVMSMMGNPPNRLVKDAGAPAEDDMHWPLILNIPGEGFGDDQLQVYRNHELLKEDADEDLFKLVENYEALGGQCIDMRSMAEEGGGGNIGPPVLDEHEKIPSNLEVDPLSWVSNEITFSPIWVAPAREGLTMPGSSAESMMEAAPSGKTVLKVSDRITVESCYDQSSSSVDMSVHYHDVEPTAEGTLPWMALGYRPTERCEMIPREGGSTPIVLGTHEDADGAPAAHRTELLPQAKAYAPDAFSTMLASRTPLGEVGSYAEVSVEAPMLASSLTPAATEDTVSLRFRQTVEGEPAAMNLMYAIGRTSELGSHATRGCFRLEDIAPCATAGGGGSGEVESINVDLGNSTGKGAEALTSSAKVVISAGVTVLTLSGAVAAMVGL